MDALKKLTNVPTHIEKKLADKWPELRKKAPNAAGKLAQHATHAFDNIAKPEGVANLRKHLGRNQHVQRIMNSQKLGGLVKHAKKEMTEVQDTRRDTDSFEASLASLHAASSEIVESTQQLADQVGGHSAFV